MIRVIGPGDGEINRLFDVIEGRIQAGAEGILLATGQAAVTIISRAYDQQVYSGPGSAFGYPHRGKPLAQAVNLETSPGTVTVFTNLKNAGYVEFGTGIYATVGARQPIKPKRSRWLAFPVWQLPPGFKGRFIPKDKARGNLDLGAIGLVLLRSVKGMKPRPVWTSPAVEKAILKAADREIARFIP